MTRRRDTTQHSRVIGRLLVNCMFIAGPLLVASHAVAEEETPQTEPTADTPAATTEPASNTQTSELLAKKEKALLAYGMGNTDSALLNLRALIATCDDLGQEVCPDPVRAELYVALAIVLAGGKNDIPAAARLFHAALTRDPEVMVPREFATVPVQKAMREANESTSYQALEGSGDAESPPPPTEASDVPPQDAPPKEADQKARGEGKTGILLLHGLLGAGSSDDGDVGTIGLAGVLGVRMVKTSAWTIAIRARASTVSYSELSGVALLMGGSWFNTKSRHMGYFMGGMGIDSYGGEPAFTTMGMGGVSLKGFLLGAGAEIGGGTGGGGGHYGLFSFHMGWGGRI